MTDRRRGRRDHGAGIVARAPSATWRPSRSAASRRPPLRHLRARRRRLRDAVGHIRRLRAPIPVSRSCPRSTGSIPAGAGGRHDSAAPLPSLVRRCLEKSREDRFHSAHDLGLALELCSSPLTADVTPPWPANRPAAAVPRRRALLYGAVVARLLASGLGGRWLDRRLRPAAVPPSFRRLTFRRGLIRSARLAPDGQTIFYSALWEGERCRVHTVRVDSPESRPLDLPDGNVLAISRSGRACALRSDRTSTGSSPTARWRACRLPVVRRVQMVEDVKFADWSPDGSDLAIVRRVDGRDRLEFPVGKVLVQPAAGRAPVSDSRASRPTAGAWRSSITGRPVRWSAESRSSIKRAP